uniref:Mur ligase C-terminal domain-containing protein n=1 Tax=Tolypothrix bouteillei VB521301 TaxID=1479485 RepID=A0A0C1R2W9_9CYAN
MAALLIGAAAEKIAGQITGATEVLQAGTMDVAVRQAYERAQAGDVVLLAPACASFDQFENYEHRGRVFKQLVHALGEEKR